VIVSLSMSINIEVEKNSNENNTNLIRRFTKRVQGSGILRRVRSIRYASRKVSDYVKKKKTLKKIERRKFVDEQIKLGKMSENPPRKRR